MLDPRDMYAAIFSLRSPWYVADVEVDERRVQVTVTVAARSDARLRCPKCTKACPGYDTKPRTWRHLDTCQYTTIVTAEVPRIECGKHGVLQVEVPWAEPGSGFTALMESAVIFWLLEANTAAVARRMRLTWDEVHGVKQRAVRRGLRRRQLGEIRRVGVDETSYQKRHEYVTVVSDLQTGHVLHVADDRTGESLGEFWDFLGPARCASLEAIAMDMAPPYISSTLAHVPDATRKICFDRFHVAKMLNDAVNTVRKQERRELRAAGEPDVLAGTKYLWTQNPENMPDARMQRFEELRGQALKVGRAWSIKETARGLWTYVSRGWAVKAWRKWITWALRSRIEPMAHVARTIREQLWGIVNAIVLRVTNARAEALNARIQWIKNQACGYRNRQRFKEAILFHLGGLDLHPRPVLAHSKA